MRQPAPTLPAFKAPEAITARKVFGLIRRRAAASAKVRMSAIPHPRALRVGPPAAGAARARPAATGAKPRHARPGVPQRRKDVRVAASKPVSPRRRALEPLITLSN